ncbi:diacylglycerol kinase family lipid kinase [soil metagenome]
MDGLIFVIANPAAGHGRGARVLAAVARATASRRNVVIQVTRAAGDETKLAQRALAQGAHTVVAVGGDGTWSKVAAALLQSERRPPLALIAAGTGNDFAKTVGAPARDIERTLALIASGDTRRVDAGTVEGRFFLVCCGFGFDTAVLERMQSVRRIRGSARYVYAALRELRAYDGIDVSIAAGARIGSGNAGRRLLMLVIANAQHYGGAFRIAPNASLTDGMLDCIAVSPLKTLARARLLLSATRGAHLRSPAVREYQSAWFDLRFAAPPVCNLDGDLHQARSKTVRVECLPAALTVVAPARG